MFPSPASSDHQESKMIQKRCRLELQAVSKLDTHTHGHGHTQTHKQTDTHGQTHTRTHTHKMKELFFHVKITNLLHF